MQNALTVFINKHNIFAHHQFGFRKSHSTELAVVDVYDKLLENLNQKKYTCAVFLDLAKAFDSVDHNILLKKLFKYGVRGVALDLLKSYLSERKQYVKLSEHKSDLKVIEIGVPQGSVLGSLLFLLFINDLPNATKFNVKLFADDTFLSLSSLDFEELKIEANKEIKKIYIWLVANKLTLNISKSKFMIITKNRRCTQNFQLKINRKKLERCRSYKYLGLFVDENLNWKIHIKHLVKKLSNACGIISKLRHCVDTHTLKMVYYALVYSYIRYCNIVYGNASTSVLRPLVTQHNQIIRLMTFAPYGRLDVKSLFCDLKLLTIPEIHILEKSKFMYKYYNGLLPALFDNYINVPTVSHNYNLRQTRNDHRQVLSKYQSKMMKFDGLTKWNDIPTGIQQCSSLKSFSYNLKNSLLFSTDS